MAELQKGWQAYRRGDFEQAVRIFSAGEEFSFVAGHALSMLAMNRGEEAVALIARYRQQHSRPTVDALLADIKGRQGARKEAEQLLQRTISQRQETGFYRSLLGEQRIRLGKWEEGTEDFIAAINMRDDRTFPHIKRVIADMVDAVAARRIPRQDAMRFINRIDYSASDKTQAINSFFASARRALNGNRRLDRSDVGEPWAIDGNTGPANSASSPGPRRRRSLEDNPPTPPPRANSRQQQQQNQQQKRQRRRQKRKRKRQHRRDQRRGPRNRPSSRAPDRPASPPPRETQNDLQRRLSQRPEQSSPPSDQLIEAKQKNMSAVMQDERRQNESLQDLIAEVHPPIWPSEIEEPLDVIAPIGFSKDTILRGSNRIETANFRITGGDIGVEITLERCMHNLIAAASAKKPTTLPMTLESIPRIELNLLDSFLDAMPDLDELYRDENEVDDPHPLAIGKFIGECIVQSYGGVWQYDAPIEASVIHLGDHELDPIGLAEDFLDTGDFDAVSLRQLIGDAEEAVETSTSFPTFANYIDPTSALEGEALALRLAELWVGYRFSLPDTAVQKIAASLNLIEKTYHFIAIGIDAQYLPTSFAEHVEGALDSNGQAGMAYSRKTGEFLILASRKHFCRLVDVAGVELSHHYAPKIAGWIQRLFRPGWRVMVDQQTAQKWGQKLNTQKLAPPSLRQQDDNFVLQVHAIDGNNKLRIIQLGYRPSKPNPYQLMLK